MALSSAAVLTVYAAGYFRTRPAAERFAIEAAERRPAPPADVLARTADVDVPPAATTESPAEPAPIQRPRADRVRLSAVKSDPAAAAPSTAAPEVIADPAPAATASSAPVPSTDAAASIAETKPAEPAAVPVPAAPRYKDGTYFGWGTSRHGDIQAAVVIDGGRIASATIAQCLTRYSCSWIAHLPPQVVSRQSPEVDYVSGATQSTNAFYYAVVDALTKAK